MPSGGNAQQKMRKSWQKMRPSRTSYRAMEGLPTVELRCPSRLLCSIPPPPLPGALWIPPPSRIIGHRLAPRQLHDHRPRGPIEGQPAEPGVGGVLEGAAGLAQLVRRAARLLELRTADGPRQQQPALAGRREAG